LRAVDDRRLEFLSLDGSTVFPWGGFDTFVMAGLEGTGVAPREVLVSRLGSGVSRLDEIRDTPRDVPFPVFVAGADHLAVEDLKRQLRDLFDFRVVNYQGLDGTFDLAAVQSGEVRRLRCAYRDGLGESYGDGSPDWVRLPLLLTAVDPDWHGSEWSTPTVRLPTPWPFLSPVGSLNQPLRITSSVALGADMPVRVTGDIPSPAVIELGGPLTTATISSPDGLSVVVGSLTVGQVFRLETGRRKRALLNGASSWGKVSSGPQWRPLPPGQTTISVEVTGATQATYARVFGDSLWQTPWKGNS